MDMAGIAGEERPSHTKFIRHAMMNPIGGKPIQLRHLDLKQPFNLGANVFKGKVLAVRQFWRYKANQSLHPTRPHGEHQGEDVFAKIDVQIFGEALFDLYIRNEEKLFISATRNSELQSLPYTTERPITAADICAFRRLNATVAVLDRRGNAIFVLSKVGQLRTPFNLTAQILKFVDQETLMIILRISECERKRAEASAHFFETEGENFPIAARSAFAHMSGFGDYSLFDYFRAEAVLIVEF